jgi:5-methylcytosine-specific restriction endonuclease McrA
MYDNDRLNRIYDKTDGHCHICHKKLAFTNHGKRGTKGAWHVEHSVPKAKGGTDHLNNLFPACVGCNHEKGTVHTKTARGWKGNTRAPHSASKKKQIKTKNTIGGAVIGGAVGALLGPGGAILGAAIGGAIGNNNSPKK